MRQKTSFALVFGDAPVARVIDFLLDNRELDYSMTDIARGADVSWATLRKFWSGLVKLGVIKRTRRVGRAELYILNRGSPLVQKLAEIDFIISKQGVDAELKRQKVLARPHAASAARVAS
jgi:predicted transcriptional regulator